MQRPLFFVVLSLASGMVGARWMPTGLNPLWLVIPIAMVLCFFWWQQRTDSSKWPVICMLSILIGLFYATSYQWKHQPMLDAFLQQQVHVRGQVEEDPIDRNGSVSFRMLISAIQINGKWVDTNDSAVVKLQTLQATSKGYTSKETKTSASYSQSPTAPSTSKSTSTFTPQPIHYGDLLEITSTQLDQPSPARNPGGFDAKTYYAQQGITYSLSLVPKHVHVIGHDDRGFKGRLFYPIRHRLLTAIQQTFPAQESAVIAGLLLGVTDQIDPEIMDSMRILGVVHILAVSGANVAMLTMPLLSLLKRTKLSARKRYTLAVFLVLLFCGVTSGGASVLRACSMAVMWCIGRMAGRESDALTSWAVAAIITVLLNPLSLFDIGFQLTYFITLGLLLLPERLRPFFSKLPNRIATPIVMTLTAELISIPLLLTINPAYTPLSLLANLYIVPLLEVLVPTAVVTTLLALFHPLLAFLPACVTRLLLACLLHPLTTVGEAGWLVRNFRAPSLFMLAAYYGWWLLYTLRKRTSFRKWGMVICATSCVCNVLINTFTPTPLRAIFLDVGQGDSSLIEMPRGTVWLVDGGGIPGFQHSNFDVGKKIVVPAISAEGIDTIDVMVMTHADEDHVRGLLAVLKRFTVKEVIVSDTTTDKTFYQQLLQEVRNRHIPLHMAQVGEVLTPELGVTVTFYNPPHTHYRGTRSDTNSNSVVFSLQYGQRSFLYTADYEGELEPKLPIYKNIDVLKVAHHGSPHSTFTPFLQRISPKIAVVSVGAHNSYGHPSKDTLQRLHDIGADIWRTDQQGAIVCETDGDDLQVSSWLGVNSSK